MDYSDAEEAVSESDAADSDDSGDSQDPTGGEIITGGLYIAMPASGVMRESSTPGLRVHSST